MRNLSIDVADFGGEWSEEDFLYLYAPRLRGSAGTAGRVVSTAKRRVKLTRGQATINNVEPGPLVVEFHCRNIRAGYREEVIIPDGTGVITLRSVMESQFTYSPPVVSAVQRSADKAAEAHKGAISAKLGAEQAREQSESTVSDAIRSNADRIRGAVAGDADRAVAAQKKSESARDAAQGHASAAESARNAAQGYANTAQGHASAAAGHVDTAAGHAQAAASSESEADKAAVRAEGARSEARTNWDNARAAQTGAEQARDDAQGHANAAQGHASTASTQATKSENAANRLWGSVSWNGGRLSVAGRQSDSLTGPQGPPGPAGSIEGLEPETIVRTGSEPSFGRVINIAGGTQFRIEARDDALYVIDAETNQTVFNANKDYLQLGGDLRIAGGSIIGMSAPTGPHQPATKQYVDSSVENAAVELPDNLVRAGADGVRMGKHFTLEHDGSSNHSTSLFLKNGSHEYEFFTNAAGKFGAWDKRHSRGLFQADRNVFDHQTAVSMGNNQLRGLPNPSGNDHAATKQYVDSAVSNVEVDTSELVPRSDVGSAENTDGGKLVRRKEDGAITVPATARSHRDAISRGEVDSKLGHKASTSAIKNLRGDLGALTDRVAVLETQDSGGSFWTGSRAEYDRISRKDPSTLYIVGV